MNAPSPSGPAVDEEVPRKRGRPRTGDKRRQILDAALKMFAERGYHGTAVPDVAREAGVGAGTLYRYFENKEDLVNEVYRDAKVRLAAAMFASSEGPVDASPRGWFLGMWGRLLRFARAEPTAFHFLEMQDHAPYLNQKSRDTELMVLAPMWFAGKELERQGLTRDLSAEVLMAFAWGALVGLLKAERNGYLKVDDETLHRAGEACWAAIERPAR